MKTSVSLLTLAFIAALAAPAFAQAGAYHEDEKLGYKVRTPKDWAQMPLKVEERWIVAKYLSDREYLDKQEGYGFKPEMWVILFPHAVTKDRGVTKTEGETEGGSVTAWEIKNPYKDYKDYLDHNYSGGGWFVSLEEEQKAKDYDWTLVEIKVEKLTYGGKKRLVAGVFHAMDADYVVHFEILEQDYDKMKATLYGCLKTFAFIARKGSIAPATSGGIDLTSKSEDEMTPEERKKSREEKQAIAFRNASEKLPPGWDAWEYRGFYVLSHVDRKFAKKVVDQAAAVRDWCEKTFDFLGDEYVRQPIIRICADYDEERAYSDSSGDAWLSSTREIVTHQDTSAGAASWEFDWVNQRVMANFVYDKDPEAASAMPRWLRTGLSNFAEGANPKGSRVEFKPDEWEKEALREARRAGELITVKELLTLVGEDFWRKRCASYEATAFVRYLLDGPGRRSSPAKDLVENYFKALRDIADEERKAREANKDKEPDSGPKTEEEEDEAFRNRQKKWRDEEEKTLKELMKRAFADWKDSDWGKLESEFLKFIS